MLAVEMPRLKGSRQVLLRWVVACTLFVARFRHELDPGLFLSWRDAPRLYLPLRSFLAKELSAGRIPVWFPYDGLGISFIGSAVGGLFNPLNVLLLALSPDQALKWQSLLLILLSGVGAWQLARELGAREAGRWLAGFTYALSGYLTSVTDNFPYLQSAAILPWTLWSAERLRARPTGSHAVAAAFAIAAVLWGGDVQGALCQALILGVFVMSGGRAAPALRLRFLTVAALMVLAWTAPVLVPVAVTALESGRATGIDSRIVFQWPLHPLRILELLVGPLLPPNILKALGPDAGAIGKVMGRSGLWAYSEMVGVIPVALAVVGARKAWRYVTVGLFALWLSLGQTGGLYPLLVKFVPGGAAFRYPEKFLPYVLGSLVALACIGVNELGRHPRRLKALLVGFGVVCLILALWTRAERVSNLIPGLSSEGMREIFETLRLHAFAAVAIGGLAWASLQWRMERAPWVLALLAALHAASVSNHLLSVADRSVVALPSPLQGALPGALHADQTRVCAWPKTIKVRGPAGRPDEIMLIGDRVALSPDYSALDDIGNIKSYAPGMDSVLEKACSAEPHCATACARRFGAGWFVASDEPIKPFPGISKLTEVFRLSNPRLVVYRDVWARALVSAPEIVAVSTIDEVIQQLQSDQGDGSPAAYVVGSPRRTPSAGEVLATERPDPARIEADVRFARAGLAVIAEQCTRGWQARVDDQPVTLKRADTALCAVEVPEGRHRIALEYVPPTWPWSFIPYWLAWLVGAWVIGRRLHAARRGRRTLDVDAPG